MYANFFLSPNFDAFPSINLVYVLKIPSDAHLTFNPTSLFEVIFSEPASPPVRLKAGIQLKRNRT